MSFHATKTPSSSSSRLIVLCVPSNLTISRVFISFDCMTADDAFSSLLVFFFSTFFTASGSCSRERRQKEGKWKGEKIKLTFFFYSTSSSSRKKTEKRKKSLTQEWNSIVFIVFMFDCVFCFFFLFLIFHSSWPLWKRRTGGILCVRRSRA